MSYKFLQATFDMHHHARSLCQMLLVFNLEQRLLTFKLKIVFIIVMKGCKLDI